MMDQRTESDAADDRIERAIEISADLERVWDLVSEPGWWINDGAVVAHRIEPAGDVAVGDVVTVHDEVHGAYAVLAEALDRPRYAAFRWMPGAGAGAGFQVDSSTLIEFFLDRRSDDDGVTVRVVESGFAALRLTDEARAKTLLENTEGWEIELRALGGAVGAQER